MPYFEFEFSEKLSSLWLKLCTLIGLPYTRRCDLWHFSLCEQLACECVFYSNVWLFPEIHLMTLMSWIWWKDIRRPLFNESWRWISKIVAQFVEQGKAIRLNSFEILSCSLGELSFDRFFLSYIWAISGVPFQLLLSKIRNRSPNRANLQGFVLA